MDDENLNKERERERHTITSPSESAELMLESLYKRGDTGKEVETVESMARLDKRRNTDVGPL